MARKPAGLAEAARPREPEPASVLAPRDPPRGRVGKKMVAGWYDRAAVKQLQRLALERDTTTQDLLGRALNLLFREEGLPPVAHLDAPDTR